MNPLPGHEFACAACHLSLGGLRPLPLAEAHTGATAVPVDELDAGGFQGPANDVERRPRGLSIAPSNCLTVTIPTPALSASSCWLQSSRARRQHELGFDHGTTRFHAAIESGRHPTKGRLAESIRGIGIPMSGAKCRLTQ